MIIDLDKRFKRIIDYRNWEQLTEFLNDNPSYNPDWVWASCEAHQWDVVSTERLKFRELFGQHIPVQEVFDKMIEAVQENEFVDSMSIINFVIEINLSSRAQEAALAILSEHHSDSTTTNTDSLRKLIENFPKELDEKFLAEVVSTGVVL